jgi:acetylornithine deacetylase/succinyl-diaminopimelate desuccinylase-like protein
LKLAKQSRVVRLLAELVALPSVNPAFVPEGDARGGEGRVTDFLAALGAREGLAVEFHDVLPGRRNVLLRYLPPEKPRQRILLAPHLDTVGVPEGSDSAFVPEIRGGRLWGRGACDTKGSVAAMLEALRAICRGPARPRCTEIVFAGLIDEECCQQGSRALVKSGFRAQLAVVGEPTRLAVVTAHKGDVWARLVTRGRAAHGATPERGRNAVREMARAVELLEGEYAAELRQRSHPRLGHPTINVGKIRGGTQPNIVPDRCVLEVDRRTLPGETEAGAKREIVRFLRSRGIAVTLSDVKGVPAPALETDDRLPWVREFLRAAGRTEGVGVHYFCDAAILSAGGTPSIVFGPGDIAQAHTAREWISVASLERGTALLQRFLQSLP